MTEQELYNEYRKSDCKSFTDFLINKITELKNERNAFKIYSDGAELDAINLNEQFTKAKNVIKKFYDFVNNDIEYDPENPEVHTKMWNELITEAEQFLSEVEK